MRQHRDDNHPLLDDLFNWVGHNGLPLQPGVPLVRVSTEDQADDLYEPEQHVPRGLRLLMLLSLTRILTRFGG